MQPSTLLIRSITLQDLETIRQIAVSAWHVAYKDIISTEFMAHELDREYSNSALKEQIETFQHQFLLLECDNAAIGFISYSVENDIVTIHKLYLQPHTKGQGYGQALMLEVEKKVTEQTCQAIELKVNRSNSAVTFYQKQGYCIAQEVDTLVGEGFLRTDYLMRKVL